jgi:hypothetical protein
MSETELQLAKQRASEQKLRVLRQQTVVLGLRREGGRPLEEAVALWEAMKLELNVLEGRLDELVLNA